MKVPYTWLTDYVTTELDPPALANKLTMAGLEVDRLEQRWAKIVTAQIVFLEPVKGSKHLNATRVTTGDGEERSVVCGAPNIKLHDIVPLALPGAQFVTETGETLTITATKKMGVLSNGMLCSPRELGLSNDHDGIYLLPPETPLGVPLAETVIDLDIKAHRGDLFGMTGVAREVAAFNRSQMRLPALEVPERGPTPVREMLKLTVEDTALCPRFTARVISGVTIGPAPLWMVQRLAAAGMRSINNIVDITNYVMLELGQPLHAFDYATVVGQHLIVRHAKAGEKLATLDGQVRDLTPDMLLVCDGDGPSSLAGVMGGARSEISDTTTTILLEAATWNPGNIRRTSTKLGLRSEASSRFEKGLDPNLAKLGLDRAAHLLVELAGGTVAPGYLDNYPHPVTPRELRLTTHDVEWLLGYPVTPGETAAALAALEFGVTLDGEGEGMTVTVPTWRGDVKEAADLVEEVARVLGYDRIIGTIPAGPLPEPQQASWYDRQEHIRDILAGAGLREIVTYPLTSRAAMLNILSDPSNGTPLLFGAVDPLAPALGGNGTLDATSGAAQLATSKKGKAKTSSTAEPTALAATSTATPTLAADHLPAITLVNPLSARQDTLRLTLLVSLLETLEENVRQGTLTARLFEVGRRYIPSATVDELPSERRSIGIALTGKADEGWLATERDLDFFDLKAAAETVFSQMHISGVRYTPTQHPTFHPGRCALIELPVSPASDAPTSPAGIMGEIHPEVAKRYGFPQRAYALELDLERLYAAAPEQVRFHPISRFPALTRDLAVVVNRAIPAIEVAETIRAAGGELAQSVTLFDVYEGAPIPPDQRSLAFTIVYQAPDRTLNDADGDAERAKVVAHLKERFGASIRE